MKLGCTSTTTVIWIIVDPQVLRRLYHLQPTVPSLVLSGTCFSVCSWSHEHMKIDIYICANVGRAVRQLRLLEFAQSKNRGSTNHAPVSTEESLLYHDLSGKHRLWHHFEFRNSLLGWGTVAYAMNSLYDACIANWRSPLPVESRREFSATRSQITSDKRGPLFWKQNWAVQNFNNQSCDVDFRLPTWFL